MITPTSNVIRLPAVTPLAATSPSRSTAERLLAFITHPDTTELFWSLAALWLVATLMMPLAGLVQPGDGRFNRSTLQSVQLPAPVLETACADYGQWASAETALACGTVKPGDGIAPQAHFPEALQQAVDGVAIAFAEPARPLVAEISVLEERQRLGAAPEGAEALDEKIAARRAELAPYLSAYGLEQDTRHGPAALQCAAGLASLAWSQATAPEVRANLALWLTSHLDGLPQAVALSDPSYVAVEESWSRLRAKGPCAGFASAEAAATALAGVTGAARQQAAAGYKSDLSRKLFGNAWWQWPLWTLAGLLLVKIYRRAVPADRWRHSGLVLIAWAAIGCVSQVWLPFADTANLQWTILAPGIPFTVPPMPLLVMAGAGAFLWCVGSIVRMLRPASARTWGETRVLQEPSSGFAYPGLILFAGIGWLLLLDLSATGHVRNRFLGLYQQGFLWGAIGLVVLATLWRQRAAYLLVRWFGLFEHLASAVARLRAGAWWGTALLLLLVVSVFFLASGYPQVTSELGRLWLILGVSWYFYVEGDLASRLASKGRIQGFVRFLFPLLVVLAALGLAMLVTDDMGPLLVSAYGGGVFLAAAVTCILQLTGLPRLLARLSGLIVLCAWFVSLTEALFTLGRYGATTASRLESAVLPLISRNDQISVITWFRESAPLWGYGVGGTPWCGHAAAERCRGVPLQIHSDYTFTALWGLFGPALAGVLAVGSVVWLYLVIRRHGRVTTGTPVATRQNGIWNIETQAFLSWVCVTWLILTVCQIVVTVAGNLRVLPLTGITYPFISFGKTSLWVNAVLLGLAMTVDIRARPAARKN